MVKHVYITLRSEVVGPFVLTEPVHAVGSGEQADLVLPVNASPGVLCKIETSFDGFVTIVTAGAGQVRDYESTDSSNESSECCAESPDCQD